MPDYVLRVLGPPGVVDGEGRAVEGLSPLFLLLVAYLALHPKPLPRDHLARLFWPGAEAPKARHSLRQLLSRIRSRLPGAITTSNDHVGVHPGCLSTDLEDLEAALGEGSLARAVPLWRGEFLEGLSRPGSWELEDWMERERARVHRLLETTLALAVHERLVQSRPLDAAELLARLPPFPASEDFQLLRARVLASAGRRPEAEALLVGLELDQDDPRLPAVLEAMEKGHPPHAPAPEPQTPSHPEPSLSPPSPIRRRRTSMAATAGILATVALAVTFLVLGGRTALDTPTMPPSFPAEIWFCSQRETEWAFRMDQDGGAKRSVSTQEVCPVLPYNGGEEAVALRTLERATEILRLVGGAAELLVRLPGPAFVTYPPRQAGPLDGVISPDGRWLVLTVASPPEPGESPPVHPLPGLPFGRHPDAVWSLFLLDLADGSMEEIARSGTRDYGGRFSPDGSRLVWISERAGAGDLYSMDLRTREVTRLTSHELPDREFSLAHHRLVLRRGWWEGPRGGEELVLLHLDTGLEEPLTENDWNDAGPDLSAGGKAVCWTSKKDGHFESEILVMDLTTRAVTNVSDFPGPDDFCQWHPTEPVVFFLSWRDGNEEIYRSQWGPASPAVNLSRYPGSDNWPSVVPPR
jgi:DNA-binding SARP family transcriptional activator